jgi:hypothetical protein
MFISYSSTDEKLKTQLEAHLAALKHQGLLETWEFRKLQPGVDWQSTIRSELESAEIIILLVSADFLASEYCWHVEMMRALERHERNECRVVPLIVRECDWQGTPLGEIQALPDNGKPVVTWQRRDAAWKAVVVGLRRLLSNTNNELRVRSSLTDSNSTFQDTDVADSGLMTYYRVYPKREMIEHLGRARQQIDILQTWVSNWSAFWVAMQMALQFDDSGMPTSDVRIRVILIDPKSGLCGIRGEHSGVSAAEAIDHTKLSVRRLREFKSQFSLTDARLEIRLSGELPTFAMFGTEEGIYFNPYLRQRITYESPCFVFSSSETGFARELRVHFDGLWDKLGLRAKSSRRRRVVANRVE